MNVIREVETSCGFLAQKPESYALLLLLLHTHLTVSESRMSQHIPLYVANKVSIVLLLTKFERRTKYIIYETRQQYFLST